MDANKKFKLLGFNHSGELSANIMVLSTGKMIHMDLKELVDSEISDDLSRHELNALYKKTLCRQRHYYRLRSQRQK
ncbi:hypothetical protein DZS_37870 [Dickeya ananatis]